jgi:hypothetical protein
MLHSTPMDFQQHIVQVSVHSMQNNVVVAVAPEFKFVYGNRMDYSGPGAFNLTTEFSLDLTPLGTLGYYTISVSLDSQMVANTLLMLRRG